MNFVVTIVILNIFAAIEAKHRSDSTDVSSREELTMEDDSSGEAIEYPDDPGTNREHVHKHGHRVARIQFETRRWHRNCLRKASKMCTKACEKAFKYVCKKHKCSQRSKKTLKRECKRSCTKNFEFDKDRAAYEE